jgi:hypothetical protein
MLGPNQPRKGRDIVKPIVSVEDVPLPGGDGIVALPAEIRCVDGGFAVMLLQVLPQQAEITGRPGDPVESDHHQSG